MSYCINCGNKLPAKAKFCSVCGEKFSDSKDQGPSIQNDAYQEERKSKQEDNSITKKPRKKPRAKKVIGKGVPQRESDSEGFGCVDKLWSILARLYVISIGITLFFTNPSEEEFTQYLKSGNNENAGVVIVSIDEVYRKNYLLFSIHEFELSILDNQKIPTKYIGIFKLFFELE